jgi:hypothetical protein
MALPTVTVRARPIVVTFADGHHAAAVAAYEQAVKEADRHTPDELVALEQAIGPDESFSITFDVVLPTGERWEQAMREHPSTRDGYKWELATLAPALIAECVTGWTSDRGVGETGDGMTVDEARALWTSWPQWARAQLWDGLYAQIVAGPGADPFLVSRMRRNGDG